MMDLRDLETIFAERKQAVEREVQRLTGKHPRDLGVDECPGCEGGVGVRYCALHGLHGTHPR